jgi:predicted RNase H-like nuclease
MTVSPEGWALGIDLAWSAKNPTGMALARVAPEGVIIEESGCVRTDDEIVRWADKAKGPLTIAIDAPTVVPNETGMRPCERQLQELFGRHHAGPYPGNRQLLGKSNGGVPRGEVISRRFQQLGAKEWLPTPGHDGVSMFEVFPAPALVRLFELEKALVYKKKSKRSWETCRAGLSSYLTNLPRLVSPSITMATPLVVNGQHGKAFKHIEDQVDAVTCAYLAALAWLHGEGRLEMIGSLTQGYVVLPRAAHSPTRPA